ncbi:MAG: tyrosine-type recombinase/integrase [Defluviicoccus sp.]|nr:tyrosine-type recombinase/integrase [Defluviicoccus sp.]
MFPSLRDPFRPRGHNPGFWDRVRREAGNEDVRPHDLCHAHATQAVMNGVPVPVVSRLLGKCNVRMTLRYAHLGDRDFEAAAEREGQVISTIMDISTDCECEQYVSGVHKDVRDNRPVIQDQGER